MKFHTQLEKIKTILLVFFLDTLFNLYVSLTSNSIIVVFFCVVVKTKLPTLMCVLVVFFWYLEVNQLYIF